MRQGLATREDVALIGSTLSHYKILRHLGKGGMGDVYVAEDTKLGRKVALKLLPPEMAECPERRQRFEREARAVAALNHPNIVTLHSVEESDGKHFITMELVEGKPLSQLIPSSGLAVERFFSLAVPLLDALTAAHEAGITHRDLKPENVIVGDDGRLRVLDFGLAKLREETPADESSQIPTASVTQEGKIVGTVAYMSPEQAQGKPVDHRSDVFSVGVLMYEMATGRRPFEGDTSISIISSIIKDTPASVTDLKQTLPRHLGRIVKRCLTKDPGQRFQSTVDLRNELAELRDEVVSGVTTAPVAATAPTRGGRAGWLVAAAIVVIATVVFVVTRQGADEAPPPAAATAPASGAVSVAVLPFANMSPDAENEYFSDGITEELINALVKVEGLKVPARTSAFALKGTTLDIREVGEKLGVDHVLEGSVRRSGDRLRITAQLVKVDDGFQLWSDRYDRQMDDVFAIQEEIAQAIVGKLEVRLARGKAAPLVFRPTENIEAYNLYLQGRYQWNRRNQDGVEKALDLFQRAIDSDPGYALAWSGLADSWITSPEYRGTAMKEAYGKAKEAALRAVELDDSLAEAHTSLGQALRYLDRDIEAAEREFRLALELNPRYPTAHHWYGMLLMDSNRPDGSIAQHEEAERLDPLSMVIKASFSWRLREIGRLDEAILKCHEQIELAPESAFGPYCLADAALRKFDYESAIRHSESYEADGAYEMTRLVSLAEFHHLLGRDSRAVEWALAAREAFPARPEPLLAEASARAALGEVEDVARLFDEALQLPGLVNGRPLVGMGGELLVHGHEVEAQRLFERAIEWHRSREEQQRFEDLSYPTVLFASGMTDEAREAWRRVVASPEAERRKAGFNEVIWNCFAGILAALDGDRDTALEHDRRIADLNTPTPQGDNSRLRAYIAVALGDHASAVALLREAYEHGYAYSRGHHADLLFRPLRDDPAYQKLLAELGVPESAR